MRVVITTLFLCLYFVLYFYYIYEWTNYDRLNDFQCRWFWQIINCGLLMFAFLDRRIKMVYNTHKQLNEVCFFSVIVNFLVNIFGMSKIINHPEPVFYIFNGICFALTIIILISSKRHGFFTE